MIFVSLASYRDPELLQTVKSAYDNADKPDEIVFGIYSQVAEGEHPDLSAYPTREVVVPYTEAKGAGYARAEVQKLYQDEEWFLQVDAHTLFEPHWDTLAKQSIKIQRDILTLRDDSINQKEKIPFYFEYLNKTNKRDLPYKLERQYQRSQRRA